MKAPAAIARQAPFRVEIAEIAADQSPLPTLR